MDLVCTKRGALVVLYSVRKDYEKQFSAPKAPKPREGLLGKIMLRIREERYFIALKRKIVFFSLLAVLAAGAFIPAFQIVRADFVESGLYDFISLAFSDPGALAYWNDFALAAAESLPVLSFAAVFATLFVFLGSLKFLSANILRYELK